MEDIQEVTPPELLVATRRAESMYSAVRDQVLALGLRFAETPLPSGLEVPRGDGATLLPSPTEMQDLAALISLVLSSWTQSGKMPTVEQMRSSAQSGDADLIVFITMLYSTAMLGAFLPVICSGDLDTVGSILNHMTDAEAPATTSPNISSKRTHFSLPGPSTTEKKETISPSSTSRDAAPATSSTSRKKINKPTKSSRTTRKKKKRK